MSFFTEKFYSLYAVFEVQFTDGNINYGNSFFLDDKPASIIFQSTSSSINPLSKYIIKNVRDFKNEKLQMFNTDSVERRLAREYENLNFDKINSGKYPDIQNYYFNVLLKNIRKKKIEYITANPTSYFSFYTFKTEIAWRSVISPDSLLKIFNKQFPDSFQLSDEGNLLKEFIISKNQKYNQEFALDFSVKDINNKLVALSAFRNKYFVLLHFWATWCSPCLKELPMILKIDSSFRNSGLRIISIASKSKGYNDFLNDIKKYRMNWTNIYNNQKLELRYGAYSIPRLILIDKYGKIIYDTFSLAKKDDLELNQLMEILKHNLN